jgi:hypothetical protein
MKWRVLVELTGGDGTVLTHEISIGGSNTAECSAATVGLTLADGKRTHAGWRITLFGRRQRNIAGNDGGDVQTERAFRERGTSYSIGFFRYGRRPLRMQRHVVSLKENPTGCYFEERFGYAYRLQKKERSKRLVIDTVVNHHCGRRSWRESMLRPGRRLNSPPVSILASSFSHRDRAPLARRDSVLARPSY